MINPTWKLCPQILDRKFQKKKKPKSLIQRKPMAVCALCVAKTPLIKSFSLQNPKPNSFSCTMPSSNSLKKRILEAGIGLIASSILTFSPLEADATRIEYYATVSEPSCDLNFARSGLGYCDVVVGSGPEVPYSELIDIHYTARFADGTVFDSSYKRGRPLTMRLGVGKVIRGLDQGILGGDGVPPMQVGGKRKLQIPPELAYGPEPAGCFSGDCNIPANATLVYDINFVGIYRGNRK